MKQNKLKCEDKYRSFDILKFLCAILISCVYHYNNDFSTGNLFDKFIFIKIISNYGWLLVELFFIISGFFFYISYYDKIIKNKLNLKMFIKSRYMRLIPIAALSSILMFILQNIYYKMKSHYWLWQGNDFISLIFQATGLQSWLNITGPSLNNALWYISVLLFCYVLYYLITKISKKRSKSIYLVVLIFAIILYSYGFSLPLINYNMLRGIISFGIGIILAILLNNKNNIKRISNISIVILTLFIISVLIFKSQVIGDKILFLDLIVYPCLVINLVRFENLFRGINSKLTAYLSNLSFGIYVWNLPIQLLIIILDNLLKLHINYASWYMFLIQIIIHIIVGIISLVLLENKLCKKLIVK